MILQNLRELFLGLLCQLHIVWRLGSGNVLAHISRGKVQTAVDVAGIQFHRLLEELHGVGIFGALVRLNALIDAIARLQLVAASREQKQQSDSQYEYFALHRFRCRSLIDQPQSWGSSGRFYRWPLPWRYRWPLRQFRIPDRDRP